MNLLPLDSVLKNTTRMTLIKNTFDYYLSVQFEDGNFPTPLTSPYPLQPDVLGNKRICMHSHNILVQWCHGAPGFMPLLTLGYKVFNDQVSQSLFLFYSFVSSQSVI